CRGARDRGGRARGRPAPRRRFRPVRPSGPRLPVFPIEGRECPVRRRLQEWWPWGSQCTPLAAGALTALWAAAGANLENDNETCAPRASTPPGSDGLGALRLAMRMRAPCSSAIFFTTARPRPVPFDLVVTYGSK